MPQRTTRLIYKSYPIADRQTRFLLIVHPRAGPVPQQHHSITWQSNQPVREIIHHTRNTANTSQHSTKKVSGRRHHCRILSQSAVICIPRHSTSIPKFFFECGEMRTYILPASILNSSPSVRDGVSSDVEVSNRIFACEVISQSGILLRLPQAAISTAQILLHRFYYRVSMRKHPVLAVVMSCILLATKVEETGRSVRDILTVTHRVLQRRSGLKSSSKEYTVLDSTSRKFKRWQDQVLALELLILKELGFILYVDHPHNFFFHYVNALNAGPEIAQRAWNFLNDAMRRDICLRYKPESIATAAIYLSARVLQIALPEQAGACWYELFDTSKQLCEEVCSVMADLYTRPKARYTPIDDADATLNADIILTPQSTAATASAAAGGSGGGGDSKTPGSGGGGLPRSDSSAAPLSSLVASGSGGAPLTATTANTSLSAAGIALATSAIASLQHSQQLQLQQSSTHHHQPPQPQPSQQSIPTGAAAALAAAAAINKQLSAASAAAAAGSGGGGRKQKSSRSRTRSRSRSRSRDRTKRTTQTGTGTGSSNRRRSRSRSRSRSPKRSSHRPSNHRSSQERDR